MVIMIDYGNRMVIICDDNTLFLVKWYDITQTSLRRHCNDAQGKMKNPPDELFRLVIGEWL